MKKTNVLWIILDLVFLIIFNAAFFLLGGTEHNASVWISYGFIHLSYLLLVATPFLVRRGKSAAVFGFSLYTISAVYFFAELVVGVVFILIAAESVKATLLVQLCLAGIYAIMLIGNMIANEKTADAEEKRQVEIDYIKKASALLRHIMDTTDDEELKKKIERVYDAVSTSPVKSHPAVAQTEQQIITAINALGDAILDGETERAGVLADSLLPTVNERNSQLKRVQ